jgi:hypothetical protein
MSGWIRLWRKIRENPLWRERRRFSKAEAWIDLLMEAAYEDHEQLWRGLVIPVRRGQYLTTQGDLAARWKWNRETVRTFLRLLEAVIMVAIRTSKETETGYTLITIVNYDLYQGDGHEPADRPSAIGAAIRTSNDPASIQHPPATTEERKEGGKPSPASGLTLHDYLEQFSLDGQQVLRQTVAAIASTRKAGKVAQSILDGLAQRLNRYPGPVVIEACRTYLAKDYASEGKREQYLLGIVRGEATRRNGKTSAAENVNSPASVYDDPRWPHVWGCATCGGIHEGTKAQRGTCLQTTEAHGGRHA